MQKTSGCMIRILANIVAWQLVASPEELCEGFGVEEAVEGLPGCPGVEGAAEGGEEGVGVTQGPALGLRLRSKPLHERRVLRALGAGDLWTVLASAGSHLLAGGGESRVGAGRRVEVARLEGDEAPPVRRLVGGAGVRVVVKLPVGTGPSRRGLLLAHAGAGLRIGYELVVLAHTIYGALALPEVAP